MQAKQQLQREIAMDYQADSFLTPVAEFTFNFGPDMDHNNAIAHLQQKIPKLQVTKPIQDGGFPEVLPSTPPILDGLVVCVKKDQIGPLKLAEVVEEKGWHLGALKHGLMAFGQTDTGKKQVFDGIFAHLEVMRRRKSFGLYFPRSVINKQRWWQVPIFNYLWIAPSHETVLLGESKMPLDRGYHEGSFLLLVR